MVQDPDEISGFYLYEQIGHGSNSVVRLGFNPTTNQSCAIKIISKKSDLVLLKKECKIHAAVSHRNITHFFGSVEDSENVYLFLEYSCDVGIDQEIAHFYFNQLISCVEYLHEAGISHRDLKPENMLLDPNGNLKLSDFGLATVFKHKNVTRVLKTPCGTPPYVAPEIHNCAYQGDAIDIWSCGIILYVMMIGNTPWAEPTHHDDEFKMFLHNYPKLTYSPWNRLSSNIMELMTGILDVNPDTRFTIAKIKSSSWFSIECHLLTNGLCNNPEYLANKLCPKDQTSNDWIAYSQPDDLRATQTSPGIYGNPVPISFSQPAAQTNADRNIYFSQPQRQDLFANTLMTRFYTPFEPKDIFQKITLVLERFLVPYKIHSTLLKISFSTVDKRKCQLQGELTIQPAQEDLYMVLFKKSKGDPLEFKRFYKSVYDQVLDIVAI